MEDDKNKDKYANLKKTVADTQDLIQREYEGKGDFDADWE